jgi:hypothetical protein
MVGLAFLTPNLSEYRKILHLWSGNPKIPGWTVSLTVNPSNQEVPYEGQPGNPIIPGIPSNEFEKKIR